jgi:leucyl-tRNA---protein transferase
MNLSLPTKNGYDNWFVDSCAQTVEFQYFVDQIMICVSVLDIGHRDISSVYVFLDLDYSNRSLGTFSALFEIEWMRQQRL